MIVARPYPTELLRVARKVVWYDAVERTLEDTPTFLAHLMVYGSVADVKLVEKYISLEEFRNSLGNAPAGIFMQDAWIRWHKKLGIRPIPPLPRRRFPDGSQGTRSWTVLRAIACLFGRSCASQREDQGSSSNDGAQNLRQTSVKLLTVLQRCW